MADQHVSEGSSSSSVFGESSDSTVELKIKTLDSQIYSFQVERTMLISSFKEKVADKAGIPAGQQRLIFRGKVLKDEHALSEYQVENGDTLHLVERQQPQSHSDTTSRETGGNNDSRGTNDVPRNRIGQIAHSVVLGSFNVGEQGEAAMAPDLGRVIGAVLNSFGIGQTATNITTGPMSSTPPNATGADGNENRAVPRQAGTQVQPTQAFASQPFQSIPQVVQIPVASASVPIPLASLQTTTPDSLNTLLEFMNRMEQALTQDGYQTNASSTEIGDMPRVELPLNQLGIPTIEALSIVLRNAQQLLNNQASTALSHLAGRLEQEGTSSDSTARSQIQTEAMQIGLAMQHLGALLLELGRSIMTLRMGQPPAEPVVNAGPAVYISPTGPNPIMVQPSPLQTSSFFGGPIPTSNPVNSGPVGIGNPQRNINIHIHAGTSLAPMVSTAGSRRSGGEGAQREHGNAASSGQAGAELVLPSRIASGVPSHPADVTISSAAQPNMVVSGSQPSAPLSVSSGSQPSAPLSVSSGSQPSAPHSVSSLLANLNAEVQNLAGNVQGINQGQSAQPDSAVRNEQQRDTSILGVLPECTDELGQKVTSREDNSASSSKDITIPSSGGSVGDAGKGTNVKIDDDSNTMRLNEKDCASQSAKSAPLGLGLGGLERKRSSKQPKSSGATTSASHDHDQNARVSGQQVLQALASRSSSTIRRENNLLLGQSPLNIQQSTETRVSGRPSSGGPCDTASAMSQVLQNPALNGLLAGLSGQAGVGSSDALGTMMEQFTQNPAMMNAVSQIAQQVDEREIESMFSGAGRGQGGGIDFSRMIQRMMPVVSRALSGSQMPSQTSPVLESEYHRQQERMASKDEENNEQKVNLQAVVHRIQQTNEPEEIFRSVIENATQYGNERVPEDFTDELCNNRELASAYVEMLLDDLSTRLEEDQVLNKF